VLAALRSGWLTMGPRTIEFEEEFGKYAGVEHAVALSSGTAAIHLALVLAGVKEGDEVITPSLTYAATVNEIVHAGGRPVFCDVLLDTLCLDPRRAREALTPKTKAIMLVHYAGLPCAMDEFRDIADSRGLTLISDCAHALETRFDGKSLGALSDMACYSFYPNKNITTGEGGMLVVHDGELAGRARRLRLHGFDSDSWRKYSGNSTGVYTLEERGFKYNMSDIQAALGLAQMRRVEAMWRRRKHLTELYRQGLGDIPGVNFLPDPPGGRSAYHLFVARLGSEFPAGKRDEVAALLRKRGIGVSLHYFPVHLQPYYRGTFGTGPGLLSVTEEAASRIISLPLYPLLEDADIEVVVIEFRRALGA